MPAGGGTGLAVSSHFKFARNVVRTGEVVEKLKSRLADAAMAACNKDCRNMDVCISRSGG